MTYTDKEIFAWVFVAVAKKLWMAAPVNMEIPWNILNKKSYSTKK